MKRKPRTPIIGEVVQTVKGREKGQLFIVVGNVSATFTLLADGDRRGFDRAKKKNINHIQSLNYVSQEVKNSLVETGRVTNAKLRHGLIQFRREQPDIMKEGEYVHGQR